MKGAMANVFGGLVSNLWAGSLGSAIDPREFKATIAKCVPSLLHLVCGYYYYYYYFGPRH